MSDNNFKNQRFDSFLNRTIILTSRTYFKKQMNIINKERTIVDDADYSSFLQGFIDLDNPFCAIEEIEDKMQLNAALESLSAIEQAVLFLLFKKELSQNEAAQILEIYSKTVSKIKIRAIEKLKKFMEGDLNNEK